MSSGKGSVFCLEWTLLKPYMLYKNMAAAAICHVWMGSCGEENTRRYSIMKKFMVMAAGLMMAAVLGACAPTARNTGETSEHGTAPAGAAQQETVDGAAEKESMVVTDADPIVTVCVYSVKSDKSGLKQNMDGIDGDELDAQELLDKMAEMGVIEEGITVDKFEQKDGALTLDLSSLKESSDKLVVMAIANTFIQNYEAKTLELSVAGEKIGDGPMSFEKNYKKVN